MFVSIDGIWTQTPLKPSFKGLWLQLGPDSLVWRVLSFSGLQASEAAEATLPLNVGKEKQLSSVENRPFFILWLKGTGHCGLLK